MSNSDRTTDLYRHFNALVKTYDRSLSNNISTKIIESNKGYILMISPSDCRAYFRGYVPLDSDFFWNPDYPDRFSVGNNGDLAVSLTPDLENALLRFMEDALRQTIVDLDKLEQKIAERNRLDDLYRKSLDQASGHNDYGDENGREVLHEVRPEYRATTDGLGSEQPVFAHP